MGAVLVETLTSAGLIVAAGLLSTSCFSTSNEHLLCVLIYPFVGHFYNCSFNLTVSPIVTADTPLPVSLTIAGEDLFFPQIAAGDGWATTVRLMHTDQRAGAALAVGQIQFFTPTGAPRTVSTAQMGDGSQFDITIPVGGVRVLTITASGPVTVGSARFQTSGTAVGGVATYTAADSIVGVLSGTPVQLGYIPLNTRAGFSNGVAIQNPNPDPVNLSFRLLRPNGIVDQVAAPPETNPLPSFGQYSRFVTEMGFTGPISPDSTLEILAEDTGSFVALPLVLGAGFTSSAALITSDLESPVTFPQVVHGGGFTTTMRFFNPNSITLKGVLRFFNPDGSPRSVTLAGRGTKVAFDVIIPAKGTLRRETVDESSTVTVGMARLDATLPVGGAATILFGSTHLGVLSSPRMRSARVPVDTAGGHKTGVALAAGFDQANFQVTLQDRDGAGAGTVQPAELTPLPTNGQYARYVTELGFPETTDLFDSSMLIESAGPGAFVPLALLDSGGVFSTTAAARQTLYGPDDYVGSYTGTWTNSFGYEGPMSASLQLDPDSNAATISLDFPGEFGTTMLNGLFDVNGLSAGHSLIESTLVVQVDGTLSLRSNLSEDPNALRAVTVTGEFDGAKLTGEFELLLPESLSVNTAIGTWTLNKN